jgi:hypothetical protein
MHHLRHLRATAAIALVGLIALVGTAAALAAWSAPTDVSPSGVNGRGPQIALDGKGDAAAVWVGGTFGGGVVQLATRRPGEAWSASATDLSATGERAFQPQVALDDKGDGVAVWSLFDGSHYRVQAASRTGTDGAWSTPSDLSLPGSDATSPQVALDGKDNAIAIWESNDGTGGIIQSAAKPAGGAWSTPSDLSHGGISPKIGLDGSGNAVAVWQRTDFSAGTVLVESAAKAVNGAWSTTTTLGFGASPEIAVDRSGDAVAVWQRYPTIQAATRTPDGVWSSPSEISPAGPSTSNPRVGIDAKGNATAIWLRLDTSTIGNPRDIVQTASKPFGGAWSAPMDLSSLDDDAINPHIAVDKRGEAAVVWGAYNQPTSTSVAKAATRSLDGHWSAPTGISYNGTGLFETNVAVDDKGDATAVWTTFDSRIQSADYSFD